MAGLEPDDIDVFDLYDPFTHVVVIELEDSGFCEKGRNGEFKGNFSKKVDFI